MLDWHGSGMSVMEMSHRGKEFISIHAEAEALLRKLLAVPPNYKVLFMQGGAIGENAIVPLNMLRGKTSADYIDTGEWSQEVDQGGAEVLHRQRRRLGQGQRLHAHPAARELEARRRRRLRAHLPQRDHRRRRVPLHARRRQRAAGGRHVEQHPVAADRRVEVRPDLRRRAEEHRPVGRDDRDRARRPDRPRVADVPDGVRLQAGGRQRLDVQHAAHLRDLHRRAGAQVDRRRRAA